MDLIARFQNFLFQVEEDLGEAGLLLRQCEDCLIHYLQAERGMDTLAPRVRHAEANARFSAWFVDSSICHGFNLEFIGRLHEDQTVVAYGPRIAAEKVSVEVHR